MKVNNSNRTSSNFMHAFIRAFIPFTMGVIVTTFFFNSHSLLATTSNPSGIVVKEKNHTSPVAALEQTTTATERVEEVAEEAASSVLSTTSTDCADLGADLSPYDSTEGSTTFLNTANTFEPVSDKVTVHKYHRMYGQFLLPFYKKKPNMKFLEIGLGCNMSYGPGASVSIWKKLFPKADLWEAEYNAECALNEKKEGRMEGFNILTGDQGDIDVLDRWIEESGGADFDVVIDDGGHDNCQIITTFMKLWPKLRPGGLYFLEGM